MDPMGNTIPQKQTMGIRNTAGAASPSSFMVSVGISMSHSGWVLVKIGGTSRTLS